MAAIKPARKLRSYQRQLLVKLTEREVYDLLALLDNHGRPDDGLRDLFDKLSQAVKCDS